MHMYAPPSPTAPCGQHILSEFHKIFSITANAFLRVKPAQVHASAYTYRFISTRGSPTAVRTAADWRLATTSSSTCSPTVTRLVSAAEGDPQLTAKVLTSGVKVRAGLYFGTTNRWRGSRGTAHGAPRYTSACRNQIASFQWIQVGAQRPACAPCLDADRLSGRAQSGLAQWKSLVCSATSLQQHYWPTL